MEFAIIQSLPIALTYNSQRSIKDQSVPPSLLCYMHNVATYGAM